MTLTTDELSELVLREVEDMNKNKLAKRQEAKKRTRQEKGAELKMSPKNNKELENILSQELSKFDKFDKLQELWELQELSSARRRDKAAGFLESEAKITDNTIKEKAEVESKVLDKLKQEQKQFSIIVIKEKMDKTELQEQEQYNVIIKTPKVEKMGEVSESEPEEKKKPDKTVFEGSEVEEIGKDKNAIEGMLDFINKIKSRDNNFFEDVLDEQKEEQKKAGDMDIIIIKKKGDQAKLQGQEKRNIIVTKSPEVEKMGKVTKSELEEQQQADVFKDVDMTINRVECEPELKKELAKNEAEQKPPLEMLGKDKKSKKQKKMGKPEKSKMQEKLKNSKKKRKKQAEINHRRRCC